MSAVPSSWESVLALFDELADGNAIFEPMRTLTHRIADCDFGKALHPWTSMHDLCISQTPPTYPHDFPHLRIALKSPSEIHFTYVDTASPTRQWHRVESPDRAFERLLGFFDQLNWFGRRAPTLGS
jgi:hypothetical protein